MSELYAAGRNGLEWNVLRQRLQKSGVISVIDLYEYQYRNLLRTEPNQKAGAELIIKFDRGTYTLNFDYLLTIL